MAAKAHQYTIRNIPSAVHRKLARAAEDRGVSLNTFVLEVLTRESGVAQPRGKRNGLARFAGSWVHDPAVDRALAEQRVVDPRDWE
ncbi:MAG: toxin-antitoxin system HicB family antitoxin [Archangium sp.]